MRSEALEQAAWALTYAGTVPVGLAQATRNSSELFALEVANQEQLVILLHLSSECSSRILYDEPRYDND